VDQIPGDYLTEEEDEHVREAQAPDDRIKVFMKIADRRLAALNPAPAPTDEKALKKAAEEKKEWGELPKLDRAVLLRHYARAIEESIAKLEDSYERNPKSKALGKALEMLREATDRHLQTLRGLLNEVKDPKETDALRHAIEEAETANEGARKGVKAKTT
jgi:delta 1-pyrroline-5-carboxylate dehydrogenase